MLAKLGRSDRLLLLKKPFDTVEVQQLASALTEKWNSEARERKSMEEARGSEREARAYAASLAAMNRALEAARASAVASAQAKSEFLANMSKEVRESMVASLHAAERLRKTELDELDRKQQVESICQESKHLLGMLSDVHDLSSIETGRLVLNRSDASPRDLVSELAGRHADAARAKNIRLGIEVGASVPEHIRTDSSRLAQVLDHLLSNAIKFTERGEVRLSVDLEATVRGEPGRIQFQVEDTGPGISPEQRARLFEAFSQSLSGAPNQPLGAGLGLALSRRLAQVLGGELDVESSPGRGARFTLSLPCTAQVAPGIPVPAQPESSLHGRVLLVEDVPATHRLYALYLQRAGAEVEVCSDGNVALERALTSLRAGRSYDLILLDIQIPGIDGFDVARRLRAENYRGPIVAITAHAREGDRQRCIDAGCDDYLAKPVDRGRLIEACREWIGRAVPPALPSSGRQPAADPQPKGPTRAGG
jgi:signal transduction histidine kinase/ActR/RegA family two-component response regulator